MDKETKGYFDQKLLGLATKDDIEKLRQETKGSFRQVREENKANIVEWRQEIQSAFDQLKQTMESLLQQLKEVRGFVEEIRPMVGDIAELNGKIKEGFDRGERGIGFNDQILLCRSRKEDQRFRGKNQSSRKNGFPVNSVKIMPGQIQRR